MAHPRSNVPQVSQHAVERYQDHWEKGRALADLRVELEALAAQATPTKKRTLTGDATLWKTCRPDGRVILLAVRKDGDVGPGVSRSRNFIVVTVLHPGAYEDDSNHLSHLDPDLARILEDREADMAQMRAAPRVDPETGVSLAEQDRRKASQQTIDKYLAGQNFSSKAVKRACAVLGLDFLEVQYQHREKLENARRR